MEGALDWAGVYERPLCQRCFWSRKNPPPTPDEISQGMADCLAGSGQVVVGVASLVDDERTFVSVLGARRLVTLDPAPRVIPRGSQATLSGSADPTALPATVILTRPDQPSEIRGLDTDPSGRFRIALGQVPTSVLVTVVNAQSELIRLRVTAVQQEPKGAFLVGKDEAMDLTSRHKALRGRLTQIRTQRGLPPFEELPALSAAAQDEANDAQLLNKWVTTPMDETRVASVAGVTASVRVSKWIGDSVDDLVQQVERDGVVMFTLTRNVPTSIGVGLASPPDGTGARRLTLVMVAGVADPGAWDGSAN